MLLRTVSGLLGLAILLTTIWAGLFWVFLFTLAAAVLGIREFYRLHPPTPGTPAHGAISPCSEAEPRPGNATANAASANSQAGIAVHQAAAPAGLLVPGNSGEPSEGREGQLLDGEAAVSRSTPLPALLGAAWVAAFIIAGAGANGPVQYWSISLGILGAGAFVAVLWLIAFYRGSGWPTAAAYLVLGPVYVGFLLAHVMLLVQVGESFFELDPLYFDPGTGPTVYEVGSSWLIFALLVNFATDSGAYLVGRAIGSHPMAPVTSPNKTWEGAIGGFACAVVAAFLLDRILDLGVGRNALDGAWLALNWQPLVIGATVGTVSQFGDLLESRLKRLSQVKDSGVMVPGHGGALDRLDSLLITLPTVYYMLVAVLRL